MINGSLVLKKHRLWHVEDSQWHSRLLRYEIVVEFDSAFIFNTMYQMLCVDQSGDIYN